MVPVLLPAADFFGRVITKLGNCRHLDANKTSELSDEFTMYRKLRAVSAHWSQKLAFSSFASVIPHSITPIRSPKPVRGAPAPK